MSNMSTYVSWLCACSSMCKEKAEHYVNILVTWLNLNLFQYNYKIFIKRTALILACY